MWAHLSKYKCLPATSNAVIAVLFCVYMWLCVCVCVAACTMNTFGVVTGGGCWDREVGAHCCGIEMEPAYI